MMKGWSGSCWLSLKGGFQVNEGFRLRRTDVEIGIK